MFNMNKVDGMFDIEANKESMKMSSRELAKIGGKRHDHVLRDIKVIFKNAGIPIPKYGGSYSGKDGKEHFEFVLPKEETLLVVSKWSDSLRWNIIQQLKEAENIIYDQIEWNHTRDKVKISTWDLRDELRLNHKREFGFNALWEDFAYEYDMINKLVLGMTAKEYKDKHNIMVIRDHLTEFENDLIDKCQDFLSMMMKSDTNLQNRTKMIKSFVHRIKQENN